MRKYGFRLLAIVLTGVLISCGAKTQENDSVADSDEWPMMDEFHAVMASSFHPYKDSLNLEPAKQQASEMSGVASRWAASSLPKKVNNDDVKAKLKQLEADTKDFEAAVQNESDEVVGQKLNDLHDQFHALQDAWYHSGDDHAGHHNHSH